MRCRQSLTIGALSLLVSCGPATRATRFAEYAPRPPDHQIQIYRSVFPDRPYEEIGIVSSRQRNKLVSMDSVLQSLKKKAQEMGGDGIIGLSEANEMQGVVGSSGIVDRDPVLSGTVIRFVDR
jgi:hypothetical protein